LGCTIVESLPIQKKKHALLTEPLYKKDQPAWY